MTTQTTWDHEPAALQAQYPNPQSRERWQALRDRVIDEIQLHGRRLAEFTSNDVDVESLTRWLEAPNTWGDCLFKGQAEPRLISIADALELRLQQFAGDDPKGHAPRVETTVTRTLFEAAETARNFGAWVDFSAPAGLGKTEAKNEYLARTRKRDGFGAPAWAIKLDETSVSVKALLVMIARAVAHKSEFHEANEASMVHAITEATIGRRGVLIIDEAQHLADATKRQGLNTLNQLRSFTDEGCFGVVTMGNGEIYRRLVAGRGAYAQLLSRMQDYRVSVAPYQAGKPGDGPALTKDDVLAVAKAWGVTGIEEQAYCLKAAASEGALRTLTNVLRMAQARFESLDIRCLIQVRRF